MGDLVVIVILIAVLWLFFRRPEEPSEPRCPKCGGETEHYCGLGACVDMCPKCDRL
ncbi:hypothetical protein I6F34_01560 [Bradyrhizobium sp. BRP05]|nr:hypothetical protein [Bradyrhizobium sp. BRP05]